MRELIIRGASSVLRTGFHQQSGGGTQTQAVLLLVSPRGENGSYLPQKETVNIKELIHMMSLEGEN